MLLCYCLFKHGVDRAVLGTCHSETWLVEGEESALRFLMSPETAAGADPSPTPLRFGVRDDTLEGRLVYIIIDGWLSGELRNRRFTKNALARSSLSHLLS
jgi:hypothetical protein